MSKSMSATTQEGPSCGASLAWCQPLTGGLRRHATGRQIRAEPRRHNDRQTRARGGCRHNGPPGQEQVGAGPRGPRVSGDGDLTVGSFLRWFIFGYGGHLDTVIALVVRSRARRLTL